MDTEQTILRHGDELLCLKTNSRATPSDFVVESKNVILIHGFTANSKYLELLANTLSSLGINIFLFNYNSYKGIDRAAESLSQIIKGLDDVDSKKTISSEKISVVAHSMGGLVAKAYYNLFDGRAFISKIFTIGTPHDGAFTDQEYVAAFVKVCESLAGSGAPKGYNRSCLSLLQLMKKDDRKILDTLENVEGSNKGALSLASISGGKRYLELKCGSWSNRWLNSTLQGFIGHEQNDGLVKESSSDWTKNIVCQIPVDIMHFNSYTEFPELNHTHLVNNQSVALKIAKFLLG